MCRGDRSVRCVGAASLWFEGLCADETGLDSIGIYRLSGTTSKVTALKNALDKGECHVCMTAADIADIEAVDIMDEAWSSDINEVSGALKLWFRELPEPLLTYGLYHGFIEAAKKDNDRLRHIRLHEQVNDLPDPNYATLKYFMGHLDKVRRHEGINQMSASNLSIVFGPTLLGAPPEEGGLKLEDMSYQCKVSSRLVAKLTAGHRDHPGEVPGDLCGGGGRGRGRRCAGAAVGSQ